MTYSKITEVLINSILRFLRRVFHLKFGNQVDEHSTCYLICPVAKVVLRKNLSGLQLLFIFIKMDDIFTMIFIIGITKPVVYKDIYNTIFLLMVKFSKICHSLLSCSDIIENSISKNYTIKSYFIPYSTFCIYI